MIRTEAVVKFDYDKQQDDELTLRVGEVVENVRQVSVSFFSPHIYTVTDTDLG